MISQYEPPSAHADRILHCVTVQLAAILNAPIVDADADRSFIQLGGHSLKAYTFQRACAKQGIELTIPSILRSGSIKELSCLAITTGQFQTDSQLAMASETKKRPRCHEDESNTEPHSSHRFKRPATGAFKRISGSPNVHKTKVELNEMQLSLLFGTITHPGTNVIRFQETYDAKDLSKLVAAWRTVIQYEPIFSCRLEPAGHRGFLVQHDSPVCVWNEKTLQTHDEYQSLLTDQLRDMCLEHSIDIVTLAEENGRQLSTIIWRFHHSLMDGYSAKLVYDKLRQVLCGREIAREPKGHLLSDVMPKLHEMQQRAEATNRAFWQRVQKDSHDKSCHIQFSNLDSPESTRRLINTVTGHVQPEFLALRAQQLNVSPASIYHAAWAMALAAFTNSDKPCFGAVISGRNIAIDHLEDAVGFFLNVVPFAINIAQSHDSDVYVQNVFDTLIDLSNAHLSRPQDGFTREFDSILAIQFMMKPDSTDCGPKPLGDSTFHIVGDIPISVCAWDDGRISVDYHAHRYDHDHMTHLLQYFLKALDLLKDPTLPLEHIFERLMPDSVKELVLLQSNAVSDRTCAKVIGEDVITMFENIVCSHPELPALRKGDEIISYHDLDNRAAHVASHLQDLVQPQDIVFVHANRSINWIVGIYAVLKAGAVYCPLDAQLPAAIRDANFKTTGSQIFLACSENSKLNAPKDCKNILSIEELLNTPLPLKKPITCHKDSATPSSNAYVCFTSGSSGQPKGVLCTHEGLVAFHSHEARRMFACPGSSTAQIMSPAFDGSIHEIFSTLSYGAMLVLSHSEDLFAHLKYVKSACLTPSMASVLDPEDFPELVNLYLVGEPLTQPIADLWSAKKNLYNMYGPTEGTCGATTQKILHQQHVTIGPPNSSVRLYIVDSRGNLCPPGIVGEICLGGVQVARGYIGRPRETKSKFGPDPFFDGDGEFMYRTGDRGRFNQDGQVECLGRNDRLVKLRGFRLDLNDLEARVVEGVEEIEAVAISRKDDHLIAMVQPESLDVATVISKMAEVLPPYAVPSNAATVNDFPRTAVGKLDYKLMERCLDADDTSHMVAEALATPSEHKVAEIWSSVLGISGDKLNALSAFRLVGGTSILQLLLAERLKEAFQADIPLTLVIESANLRSLSREIDDVVASCGYRMSPMTVVRREALGRNQLSPLELDLWHRYQYAQKSNMCFTVTHAASLDMTAEKLDHLAVAWSKVIDRHEILRSRYARSVDGTVRRAYACSNPQVARVDQFDLHDEANRPIDLAAESPIRVIISRTMILVSVSHIICDYTGLYILLLEVGGLLTGQAILPAVPAYCETTQWSTPVSEANLKFWTSSLHQIPDPIFPPRTDFAGTSYVFEFDKATHQTISTFCDSFDITLNQFALAAIALVLTTDKADTDVILGNPNMNRSASDLDTVGNFVEILPTRITYPTSAEGNDCTPAVTDSKNVSSSLTYLRSVRTSSQKAVGHAIHWHEIVSLLNRDQIPKLPGYPLIEAMVTVHDERARRKLTSLDIPGAVPINTWTQGAKFKAMFEFRAVKDVPLMLRVEVDDQIVGGPKAVEVMVERLRVAFGGLIEGRDLQEVKKDMQAVTKHGNLPSKDLADLYFGKSMVEN